jgi:hypothetical protein
MSIGIVLLILLVHWFADFVCQTDTQAKNKSTNIWALLDHTLSYTMIWFLALLSIDTFTNITTDDWAFMPNCAQTFLIITFLAHTVTDYFTSRLNTYLWKKGDVHNFFVSIGFDQLLYYVQLLITYKLLLT